MLSAHKTWCEETCIVLDHINHCYDLCYL